MKPLKSIIIAIAITLALASSALGGTITGSRTGTITGSRAGTITGSRAGTITGSRTGTITGSRVGTITGSRTDADAEQTFTQLFRQDMLSHALNLLLQFAW